ncbi:MAG: flagellar biosynthesis protein [Rubrivivax sp.]
MQLIATAPHSPSLLRTRLPRRQPAAHDGATADQAQGLRRLFSGPSLCHLALVSNPHVDDGGGVVERLTSALCALGVNTLVVDAADTSPAAAELAVLDLRACIEPLSPQVSYLAARGLPQRHVDGRGSSAAWLDQLAAAAPQAQAVLVHAGASDLARLYSRLHSPQFLRPLVLASDHADSITHAYAAMKLLAMRRQLMSFDVLVAAPTSSASRRRAAAIAARLASCADTFLGASVRNWVALDPACDVRQPCADALVSLLAAQLAAQLAVQMDAQTDAQTDAHPDDAAARTPSILN